jgi:hypothetical protein
MGIRSERRAGRGIPGIMDIIAGTAAEKVATTIISLVVSMMAHGRTGSGCSILHRSQNHRDSKYPIFVNRSCCEAQERKSLMCQEELDELRRMNFPQ